MLARNWPTRISLLELDIFRNFHFFIILIEIGFVGAAHSISEDVPEFISLERFACCCYGYLSLPWQRIDDLSKGRLRGLWNERGETAEEEDELFEKEAFVRAAGSFTSGQYSGIIDVLTEAIEAGKVMKE